MAQRQRSWKRGSRRGLAAGAIGAGVLGLFPGGAGAATPRFYATPDCTSSRQYEVDLHIADFAPNDTVRMILGFYTSRDQVVVDFPPDLETDASGRNDEAGIDLEGDEPHRIGGLFYHDRDGDKRYTEGDDVVANLIMTIDQPCTGAEASPK